MPGQSSSERISFRSLGPPARLPSVASSIAGAARGHFRAHARASHTLIPMGVAENWPELRDALSQMAASIAISERPRRDSKRNEKGS